LANKGDDHAISFLRYNRY